MHDFPLTQEADGIADLGILYQTKDVVVGGAGFLLCCNLISAIIQKFQ